MTEGDANAQPPAAVQAQAQADHNKILKELLDQRVRHAISQVYSNSLHFENGELDFKIVFGQMSDTQAVDWRTAVTMPWALAKLMSFYLQINLKIYEAQHGTIKIPGGMFPAAPTAPPDLATNATSKEIFEFMQTLHQDLITEYHDLVEKTAKDTP